MRPIVATVGPLAAAAANNIALSQTPAGAGALTLNGSLVSKGIATLDNPRRVLITTADTTTTFTVTGTTPTGSVISESFKVAGGSSYTAQDFKTVTSITVNQGTTAAVTVGTNGLASTPWVRTDEWADPFVSIQCDVTGTVSYTVEESNDDPNDPSNPVAVNAMTWLASNDTNVVASSTSQLTNFLGAPRYVRVTLNSGSGSVTAVVTQYNTVNR